MNRVISANNIIIQRFLDVYFTIMEALILKKKHPYIELLITDIFKIIMKIMWFNRKISLKFTKYASVKLVIRNNRV